MRVDITFIPPTSSEVVAAISARLAVSGIKVNHASQHFLVVEIDPAYRSQLDDSLDAACEALLEDGERINVQIMYSRTYSGSSQSKQ